MINLYTRESLLFTLLIGLKSKYWIIFLNFVSYLPFFHTKMVELIQKFKIILRYFYLYWWVPLRTKRVYRNSVQLAKWEEKTPFNVLKDFVWFYYGFSNSFIHNEKLECFSFFSVVSLNFDKFIYQRVPSFYFANWTEIKVLNFFF